MSDAVLSDDAGAPGLVPLRLDVADFGARSSADGTVMNGPGASASAWRASSKGGHAQRGPASH